MATYECSASVLYPVTDFLYTGSRAVYPPREAPENAAFGVYEPPDIPPVDSTDPVIGNFVPTVGTEIARTDPIQFDVTDETGLASVYITARYEDGTAECVWDHDSFQARFLAGSSRNAITDGYRFVIRRAGGWLSTPIILDIVAIDMSGNVTTESFE